MAAIFLIFLRESLEGSLLVFIMLAILEKLGERRRFAEVVQGVVAALVIVAIGGYIVFQLVRSYNGSVLQTILEGITYLIAAVILGYLTIWARRQAQNLRAGLEADIRKAVAGSGGALFLLAFLTVGREGLETMVFSLALAYKASGLGFYLAALLGLLLGTGSGWVVYRLGRRFPLGPFLNFLGYLLLFFGAGLLADAIQNFAALGWIPGGPVLWNTARILSENSTLGDILHSFLGYAEAPGALQFGGYLAYVIGLGYLLFGAGRTRPSVSPLGGGRRGR